MTTISPALIKELREATNAGLMDCKKALSETNGDMKEATIWLRKKGLSKAAKISGKIAAEGLANIKIDGSKGVIVEINSETDFVAKNENFINFVNDITDKVFASNKSSVNEFKALSFDGKTYEDILGEATAKVGEKIDLRRFQCLKGLTGGYVHANGKIATLILVKSDLGNKLDGIIKDIAMHTAAMSPLYLDKNQIPKDIIERETQIAKEQLKKEGKPEAIWDKIIPGKISKFAKDTCLLEQSFVKDDKKSVKKALDEVARSLGGTAEIVQFVRYEVGEGIEKKCENFADEVAAQLKRK